MRRGAIIGLITSLLLAMACGGSSEDDSDGNDGGGSGGTAGSGGGGGVCVSDARAPGTCQTQWLALDSCDLFSQGAMLEAAVFDAECPPDPALAQGDTSAAISVKYTAVDVPFSPFTGLAEKPYGFALLLRDAACQVLAYGCTPADFAEIVEVRTALRNWLHTDPCTPTPAGGCPLGATCASGRCQ